MEIEAKPFLHTLFHTAITEALPDDNIEKYLPESVFFNSANHGGRTVVIGAGKAAASMAKELEQVWSHKTAQDKAMGDIEGVVVTRYGHTLECEHIEVIEASHPVPDAMGMEVGQRLVELATSLSKEDTVICLISGGGSALLSLPAPGITLTEKQNINKALLKSGAAIDEMNCVRKHLSAVKGGRLAQLAHPAKVITLAISDVPGDDFSVIASGPTVPDVTTRFDALGILERYNIDIPQSAFSWLNSEESETVKPDHPCWANCTQHLIATPQMALEAAAEAAQEAGINAYILSDSIEGEAKEVAKVHAALAKQIANHQQPFTKPCVVISGGETTVTVKGRGRGGRNCEFLLALFKELKGQEGIYALAADTDGIDGIEDNAGAWFGPKHWQQSQTLNLNPELYLENNDSYSFFKQLNVLTHTGPTLTNVNDFRAILVL